MSTIPLLMGLRGPGRYVGDGGADDGFVEPPIVTETPGGDVTINGKVKPGAFGKFVFPLATLTAGRQYTLRYTPHFQQLAQQGKLAMVGFGMKTGNDFHMVGLRGDGTTGVHRYKVYGTPPNGWNKQEGHTVADGAAPTYGTQAGPNYIRLVVSADGTTYTFYSSTDGVTYEALYSAAAPTPFTNVTQVTTFGVALWFNNADAGIFSITIDLFADAVAGLLAFVGSLAYRDTSTQAVTASVDTPVQYNAEEYDTASFHDTVTNNSRFTVPVAYNGRKGRLTGNMFSNTGGAQLFQSQWKNGSLFQGAGGQDGETANNNGNSNKGAVVALTTSDYFENIGNNSDASSPVFTNDPATWGCFEVMPADFAGALLKHSATQTIDADTNPLICAWDGEEYDTNTFHDTAVNNSRLTIPALFDGRYVRLSAGFRAPGAINSGITVEIRKNGSTLSGLPHAANITAGSDFFSVFGAPVVGATGDYFEVYVTYSSTTAVTVPAADPNIWFQLEVMPEPFSGTLISRSTNQAVTSAGAYLSGEIEDYDVGGWWSAGAPTRMTVPAGVSKVRITANSRPTSTTVEFWCRIEKNGAVFNGMAYGEADTAGSSTPEGLNLLSAVVDVIAGDYFEFWMNPDSSENHGSLHNWMAIETVAN